MGPRQTNMNVIFKRYPDSKIHGANMGPTWVLSALGGPHVGPINLDIRVTNEGNQLTKPHHNASLTRVAGVITVFLCVKAVARFTVTPPEFKLYTLSGFGAVAPLLPRLAFTPFVRGRWRQSAYRWKWITEPSSVTDTPIPVIMATFVVTGGTAGCHNDNLRCHQWRQSWHYENYLFSAVGSHRGVCLVMLCIKLYASWLVPLIIINSIKYNKSHETCTRFWCVPYSSGCVTASFLD